MKIKTIFLILLCVFLSSCVKLEKVYTWKRSDSEVFTVRWKMDKKHNLTLLVNYFDGKQSTSWINNYFENCNYFNDNNWTCNAIRESISMSKGNLDWSYWSEDRNFKPSYEILWE